MRSILTARGDTNGERQRPAGYEPPPYNGKRQRSTAPAGTGEERWGHRAVWRGATTFAPVALIPPWNLRRMRSILVVRGDTNGERQRPAGYEPPPYNDKRPPGRSRPLHGRAWSTVMGARRMMGVHPPPHRSDTYRDADRGTAPPSGRASGGSARSSAPSVGSARCISVSLCFAY